MDLFLFISKCYMVSVPHFKAITIHRNDINVTGLPQKIHPKLTLYLIKSLIIPIIETNYEVDISL